MTLKELTSRIDWRAPKYMLPAILYPLLLGAGYFIFDVFDVKLAEKPSGMQTTEYLNPELPQAQLRTDEIGGKYENMAKSYGKIQDYSAVENIDREQGAGTEAYDSKYTEQDLALLDEEAERRLQEMQSRLDMSRERGMAMANDSVTEPLSEDERLRRGAQRQQEALDEQNKALAEARLNGLKGMEDVQKPQPAANDTLRTACTVTENEDAVTQPPEDAATQTVVKAKKPNSAYFNTLAENGSRVRLRLLDEVEINGVVLARFKLYRLCKRKQADRGLFYSSVRVRRGIIELHHVSAFKTARICYLYFKADIVVLFER